MNTRRHRPAFDPLEGRSLCAINGLTTVAILGTGTNPVGILAGHVLPGLSVVDPSQTGDKDQNGHDTLTASVAERWYPGVQILPIIDVLPDGTTTDALISLAIDAAVAAGADVISVSFASAPTPVHNSLDGFDRSPVFASLLRAGQANVPVVVAAGNAGNDNDANPVWPSNDSAALLNVVSVAAADPVGNLAWFNPTQASNYGAKTVTLGAPGLNVPATNRDGADATASGTSVAAPAVAATLARIVAADSSRKVGADVAVLRGLVTPTPGMAGTTKFGGELTAPPATIPPPLPMPPIAFGHHWPVPTSHAHRHHTRRHR